MSAFPKLFAGRNRAYSSLLLLSLVGLLPLNSAMAQTREPSRSANVLRELNEAVEDLVQRVSPTVVQILVTGYGAAEETERGQADVLVGRRRAIGSGVIVDPQGYIITNAHVVNGAQNIEVLVPPPPAPTASGAAPDEPQGRSYQARVVGTSREIDLAVIKIDGHGLPALSISSSMPPARQGEMVFAFGSPEGLRNTVTMGVVSAVARQPDPDSPLVYIQTDTPINPGNSGGPLVNANGDLVGINTFILSSSGGNQGLGFAIPEGVVASAYPQLVKFGHIHQPAIGALVQTITPELAAALRLKRDFGVIISDISPGGPADIAGLKIQDVVVSVDGVAISSLPQFAQHLYLHKAGDHAAIEILRGSDRLKLNVGLAERPHKEDSLIDVADPVKNLVRPLDVLGVELTLDLAKELPDLRIPTGVIVAARTLGTRTGEIPLQTGDVIHGLNGTPITSLDGLRTALLAIKPGEPVALQIERHQQIFYVSFTR